VRQALLKAIGLVSLIAFPTLWGISSVAPELVRVILGPEWLQSVPALTILPLVVPIRMACSVLFTTSLALGNRRLDVRNTITNFVLIPSGFFIGAHWGLVGLCLAWLVSVPLAYSLTVPGVLRLMGIRGLEFLAQCGMPAVAAGVMYAAVAALRSLLAEQPAFVALLALSVAGGLVYFSVMALVSRRHLVVALSFARSVLAKKASNSK
jgi:O-antigen/teichoic acid export membrane protein